MKLRYCASVMLLVLPLSSGWAAEETTPMPRRIDLTDGTYIILETDGTMSHYDSQRRPMAPGKRMEGKDGTVYEMRNNALWQRLWLRGTLKEPK